MWGQIFRYFVFLDFIFTQAESCDAKANDNAGCGVVDWSRVSYGPQFDVLGGGMYAMMWDETGIAVCVS